IHRPNLHPIILLPMGDGNAAFRLASNLKTAWLGSTCQGYGVSAYAIRTYSISVMCIFKFISREICNTKKVTFHVYFYYVKFYCCRSKEQIKPSWVYFGHIRLVYLAHLHIQLNFQRNL